MGNTESREHSFCCISPNREETYGFDCSSREPALRVRLRNTPDFPIYQAPHDKSDLYDMQHQRRGIFVILDNSESPAQEIRVGSEKEVENLKIIFSKLGFEVRIKQNLTKKDVISTMEQVAQENHTDCDCFGMAVLSHGNEGDALAAYDGQYYVQQLYKLLNGHVCTSLRGKPKLFFFNACKGTTEDIVDSVCTKSRIRMLESTNGGRVSAPLLAPAKEDVTQHAYSDFLCAFSTWEGYKSYRHPKVGSLYIHYLFEELLSGTQHGDDLTLILSRVSRRLAENPAMEGKKILRQTCWYQSSLTKKVVLHPKQ